MNLNELYQNLTHVFYCGVAYGALTGFMCGFLTCIGVIFVWERWRHT